MSSIEFKHRSNNRKTWLVPLIIIALLYLSIPILLINKGKDSFEKAGLAIENNLIQAGNYYNSGIIFTDLAENFPGFSAWAKKTGINGKNKLMNIYSEKCKEIQDKSKEEQNKFCEEWKVFAKKTSIKLPECKETCK
ncbi:MAG: hypothetical protein L3J74_07695 [Bacteroidales bacterium]|nr:hypothetical protein [Bacteroidales bacterium]